MFLNHQLLYWLMEESVVSEGQNGNIEREEHENCFQKTRQDASEDMTSTYGVDL